MDTRNHRIDILRLLAAFAVVCLHSFSGSGVAWAEETVALSRFAVPLFFLFSGYFAANFTMRRRWKQAGKLFLLAVFSNLGYMAVALSRLPTAYARKMLLRQWFPPQRLWDLLLFNESPISGHLWFLGALLYCVLLDILFCALFKRERPMLAGIASAALLLGGLGIYHWLTLAPSVEYQLFHYRNFLLLGLPFFTLGKLLRRCGPLRRPLPGLAYPLLILLSLGAAWAEFRLLGVWELYLGSVLAALTLCHWAVCHPLARPKGPARVLAWLGRYASLPVYILHIYFLDLFRNAYYAAHPWQYEFGPYHMLALLTFLASLAASLPIGALGCWLAGQRARRSTPPAEGPAPPRPQGPEQKERTP